MSDCIADEATVDDALKELIRDTSLMEVVCCLDMIATKEGSRVAMFNWQGRQYPANGGDLEIPAPDWKLNPVEEIKKDDPIIVEQQEPDLVEESSGSSEPEDETNENTEQAGSQDLPDNNESIGSGASGTGGQILKDETIDNNQGSTGFSGTDGKSDQNG